MTEYEHVLRVTSYTWTWTKLFCFFLIRFFAVAVFIAKKKTMEKTYDMEFENIEEM